MTDGFWLTSYGLLGAAALHPSMGSLTAASEAKSRPAYARLLVLGGALVLLPTVEILHLGRADLGRDSRILLVAIFLVIALIVVRMAKVVRVAEKRADRLSTKEAALRQRCGNGTPWRPS